MIKLEQANRMIAAIIKRGAELNCRPISAVVVEPGCVVKAFQKEDGASMIRFEMAFGKAYAALALGRSSKLVRIRNEEKPVFMRYLMAVSDDKLFAEGGGMLIRNNDGDVIGAVGAPHALRRFRLDLAQARVGNRGTSRHLQRRETRPEMV